MAEVEFTSELKVTLVDSMGSDLSVARAAWVSVKGARAEDEADEHKVAGLIKYLIQHHHGTPFEHNAMTFIVEAPIVVWREWHRHRIGFSYNEQSGRYSKLAPVFYVPPEHRPMVNAGTSARPNMVMAQSVEYYHFVADLQLTCEQAYDRYDNALAAGIAKEVARFGLPNNIYSTCYVTCNARSMMHFLALRTHVESAAFVSYPQWEIEQCANKLEEEFLQLFPWTYQAFCDNQRQAP